MQKIYIGIDPGVNGGIVGIYESGDVVVHVMPSKDRDVLTCLSAITSGVDPKVMIEKLWGIRTLPHSAQSIFKLASGYGGLKMALASLNIKYSEVAPRTWQPKDKAKRGKDVGLKVALKGIAKELYPDLPVWQNNIKDQFAIADALLIADYCRRLNEGLRCRAVHVEDNEVNEDVDWASADIFIEYDNEKSGVIHEGMSEADWESFLTFSDRGEI